MIYDIIIIGAGASGLAAAYKAASFGKKLNILVLEKEAVPGRKLSAAGNGKCNLTNMDFQASCYHSETVSFAEEWTRLHSYEEMLSFFDELGIMLYQNNGYYYPVSNQGKQVTGLLYEKSLALGVTFYLQTRVTNLEFCLSEKNPYYKVDAVKENEKLSFKARHLILAAGGMAAPKLGGCRDGYALGNHLNLKQKPVYPVLSPIYVEDSLLSLAKGVRLDAMVTLRGKGDFVIKEAGQVQINEDSLSGIVIMNLSCYLNTWKKEECTDCLSIDVLPGIDWNSLKDFILSQKERFPDETIRTLLRGMLPDNFIKYILKRIRLDETICLKDLTEKQLNRLTSALKKLTFTPLYHEDFNKAQATGGGILLSEVDTKSFECKNYKKLYITGEVLDVNGKCGGYNISFAMLSGIEAASDIVRKCQND